MYPDWTLDMALVMSPDTSYGARYEPPAENLMMSPARREREPELHIGALTSLI